MKLINPLSKKIIDMFKKDKKVIAVLLFGSYARNEPYRDIDICVVLDKKYSQLVMSKKRQDYLAETPKSLDIHIFQQLPVYIRKRILAERKIIICNNEEALYDAAFTTIKDFEFYKKIYDMYLSQIEKDD